MVPDWGNGPLEARMRLTTLGGPAQGVLCEERVLPPAALVRIPDDLSFEQAACLPVAGLAAWSALTTAAVGRGSRVLVMGTGGVSMLALQIAKRLGAEVAVISASEDRLETARRRGADFTADRQAAWGEMVRRWSRGGVDAVLDIGGEATLEQSVAATRDGGCVAVLGTLAAGPGTVRLADVLLRRIRVQGIFVGSRADLERCVAFVADHALEPVIDRVFDGLTTAREAFAYFLSGRHAGKIVIRTSA
jgi:NADPH:quinone reductase-like Zn-dependent oxidoreductase